MRAAPVGADKEPGLSSKSDGAQRAFNGVVGETDTAVVEERGKTRAVVQHLIDGLADSVMARQRAARLAPPEFQLFDERRRHVVADSKPLVGSLAVDRTLNRKNQVDASHRFSRQRLDERRFAGFVALLLPGDVGKLEQIVSAVHPAAGVDRRRL